MNIYFESPQRLKIELSGTDLEQLGITYDQLDYSSARTRSILRDLLQRIGADEEFDLTNHRLVIEILPLKDNGCTIYFTVIQSSNATARRMRVKSDAPVWEIDCADDLIDAASELKKLKCENNFSLYLLNGKYRLISEGRVNGVCTLALNEYGRRVGSRAAALHTCEHGRLLSANLLTAMPEHTNQPDTAASLS